MSYDESSGSEQSTLANNKRNEKRICYRHSPQHIQILEAYFEKCPHPNESQLQTLCRELNLDIVQIKFWFQNKRTQSRAQDERSTNMLLRGEHQNLLFENEAMSEALKNVICPPCGGPAFGEEERNRNFEILRQENAYLKAVLANANARNYCVAMNNVHLPTMDRNHTSPETNPRHVFESSLVGLPPLPPVEPQHLSQMDVDQLSETAANAIEELKLLFSYEYAFWVTSPVDRTCVINQETYRMLFKHTVRKFRSPSAHIESSKSFTVVPIEATKLIEMFTDVEKWKELFPTIVNKTQVVHSLGSHLPIAQYCSLQVIWEQLHILSPLVPPRDFVMVRCCQNIQEGRLWIVANVSTSIMDYDVNNIWCCKRPSGCVIEALPNGYTKVLWIEHVEVDDKMSTPPMYKELLSSGSSGYGAQRWIANLERMCERMVLYSSPTISSRDWSQGDTTWQGRKNIMKLGERILKEYYEELKMPGKINFPQLSKCGITVSVRTNGFGQPPGVIACAASSITLPYQPLHTFAMLQSTFARNEWDILSLMQRVTELGRITTGLNGTNYVNILRNYDMIRTGQNWSKNDMLIVQDCHMDALGGVLAYAPLNMNTFQRIASGELDPTYVPILPSGIVISPDRGDRFPPVAADGSGSSRGGTLLTLAFQILVAGEGEDPRPRDAYERAVNTVTQLVSTTSQRIKNLASFYPHV